MGATHLKTLSIIGVVYCALAYYGLLHYEKYQINSTLRGISENLDRQLGFEDVTELSLKYQQKWIDFEKRFYIALGVLCIVFYKVLRQFKPQKAVLLPLLKGEHQRLKEKKRKQAEI